LIGEQHQMFLDSTTQPFKIW